MTWRENAILVIGQVHDGLPADSDLKTRRAALRKARPHWFAATSWGRKVWAACARSYLEKHGQPRHHGKRKPTMTPLEQLMSGSEGSNG